MTTFVKRRGDAPPGFFAAEAAGLAWLAEAQTVAVPRVLEVDQHHIAMTQVFEGQASPQMAQAFGRQLAHMHAAGSERFGAPWAGFIGPLPMDNEDAPDWTTFYATKRVEPFVAAAEQRGAIAASDAGAIRAALELLAGLPGVDEPPARLHGDLWSGNVLWGADDLVWLVDPAAHGGHRETDLAMLALFGVPFFEHIMAAYHQTHPLATGWEQRVGIHQLHPLAVHAVLFGGSYGVQAGQTARAALERLG